MCEVGQEVVFEFATSCVTEKADNCPKGMDVEKVIIMDRCGQKTEKDDGPKTRSESG